MSYVNNWAVVLWVATLLFLLVSHIIRQLAISQATHQKMLLSKGVMYGDVSPATLPAVAGTPLDMHMLIQAVICVILLCAALYVIISPGYGDKQTVWALGAVSAIFGFWIHKLA